MAQEERVRDDHEEREMRGDAATLHKRQEHNII